MTAADERVVATVRGLVQGVGYRWFVEREAARLGLVGWVANLSDGSVEVVVEGGAPALDEFLLALWEGPAGAAVRDVQSRREPGRGNIVGFRIRSGGHRGD